MNSTKKVLAVILTCHNRKQHTVACLKSLAHCAHPEWIRLRLYLTDDACTDGTADAAREIFPDAVILPGDGSLFWCGGMRVAMKAALLDDADYLLWLNDDVVLYPHALVNALATSAAHPQPNICIGTTDAPGGAELTYGGLRRFKGRLQYEVLDPQKETECETMNGQFVLIPKEAAGLVGTLDPAFRHFLGDLDYGLRAARAGVKLVLVKERVGSCAKNDELEIRAWMTPEPTPALYWQKLNSPRGLPVRDRLHFCRRHLGFFWWVFWLYPYLKRALLYPFGPGRQAPTADQDDKRKQRLEL